MTPSHNKQKKLEKLFARLMGIVTVLLLVSATSVSASEAWWLSVPLEAHAALINRIYAGDNNALEAALNRIPDMVKSGQLREIEKFTEAADGTAIPEHNKERNVVTSCNRNLITGSYYNFNQNKNNCRLFRLRGEGSGYGADVRVVTQAQLGNTWQLTFCVVEGDVSHLLLEKDAKSAHQSSGVATVLNVTNVGVRNINAFWFLTAADKPLESEKFLDWRKGSLQPGCGPEFSDSVDTPIKFKSGHTQMMSLGCIIRCMALREEKTAVEALIMESSTASEGIYRRGNGQLVLDNAKGVANINYTHIDYFEDAGKIRASESDKYRSSLEVHLTRIPNQTNAKHGNSP